MSEGDTLLPSVALPLDAVEPAAEEPVDVLDLAIALDRLAAFDARQARIVELLAFVGLTQDEAAELLGVSLATIYCEWRVAKLWLKAELKEARGISRPPRREHSGAFPAQQDRGTVDAGDEWPAPTTKLMG